ncbi:hypothetical protein VTH06DRAFT_3167 [Thermothelomyces fergusii]
MAKRTPPQRHCAGRRRASSWWMGRARMAGSQVARLGSEARAKTGERIWKPASSWAVKTEVGGHDNVANSEEQFDEN